MSPKDKYFGNNYESTSVSKQQHQSLQNPYMRNHFQNKLPNKHEAKLNIKIQTKVNELSKKKMRSEKSVKGYENK